MLDSVAASSADGPPPALAPVDPSADRVGESPHLTLIGFDGPLDHLLALARAQAIDLTAISLSALLDQLTTALRQAPARMPLGQKGDWVVMAAWLVQLRTRLLLPADAQTQQDATAEVGQLRDRLVELQAMQALAGWLDCQPQHGRDVFARGQPEVFGVSVEAGSAIDVVAFLWASLTQFDDDQLADTSSVYRLPPRPLYTAAAARERILQRLADAPDGGALACFLPDMSDLAEDDRLFKLQRRSAWSSTFSASLELTRQGDVVLRQVGEFATIYIAPRQPDD
jgi:segregation and condensation protein A